MLLHAAGAAATHAMPCFTLLLLCLLYADVVITLATMRLLPRYAPPMKAFFAVSPLLLIAAACCDALRADATPCFCSLLLTFC